MYRRSLTLVLTAGLAGCAALGPSPGDTMPPAVELAWSETLRERLPVTETPVTPLRERITEPQLAALVESALAANVDVSIARQRIAEARALAGVELAGFRPQLSVSASVTDQQLSENGLLPAGRIPGFEADQTIYEAGFDASWELDLFGRRRVTDDLGALRIAEAEFELVGAEDSLVAEITRNWLEYQSATAEVALLDIIVDRQQALFDATERRRRGGEASDFDVELARAQLMATQARLPSATRAKALARNRLAVLMGQSPAALTLPAVDVTGPPWRAATAIDVTLSDVLRRRPDVRAAEVRYAQAARNSDLARLEFYPRLTLFASAGPESTSTSNLTDSASLATAIGGLIDWAIFDGKRRRLQRDAATSRQAEAALAYRGVVLAAASDIESSAVRLATSSAEAAQQRAIAESRQRLSEMAQRRFDGGTVPVMTLLEAERDWADARIALVRLQTRAMIESLALQKALGVI